MEVQSEGLWVMSHLRHIEKRAGNAILSPIVIFIKYKYSCGDINTKEKLGNGDH